MLLGLGRGGDVTGWSLTLLSQDQSRMETAVRNHYFWDCTYIYVPAYTLCLIKASQYKW